MNPIPHLFVAHVTVPHPSDPDGAPQAFTLSKQQLFPTRVLGGDAVLVEPFMAEAGESKVQLVHRGVEVEFEPVKLEGEADETIQEVLNDAAEYGWMIQPANCGSSVTLQRALAVVQGDPAIVMIEDAGGLWCEATEVERWAVKTFAFDQLLLGMVDGKVALS